MAKAKLHLPEKTTWIGLPEMGLKAILDYLVFYGHGPVFGSRYHKLYQNLKHQGNGSSSSQRHCFSSNLAFNAHVPRIFVFCDPWEYMWYQEKHQELSEEEALEKWCEFNQGLLSTIDLTKDVLISSYSFLQQPANIIDIVNEFGHYPNVKEGLIQDLDSFYHESHYHEYTIKSVRKAKSHQRAMDILHQLHEKAFRTHDKWIEPNGQTAKVNVVIPCYNLGQYMNACLASLERSLNPHLFDVTIIDDGSTQEESKRYLQHIEQLGYKVSYQQNQGLCATLNNGVEALNHPYVMVLSADDTVDPGLISKAVEILDKQDKPGVVYTNPKTFESRFSMPDIPDFDPGRMLKDNYIVATAVYNKSLWEMCGKYDPHADGNEDWDMWIGCYEQGAVFHHLNEYLFHYRIRIGSKLSTTTTPEARRRFTGYLASKHSVAYGKHLGEVVGSLQAHLFHFINQEISGAQPGDNDFLEMIEGRKRLGIIGSFMYRSLRKVGHLSLSKRRVD